MKDKNAVASLHSSRNSRRRLWKKAIKWPLYSVAIMPIILAAGWKHGTGEIIRIDQLLGFLLASILLLIWENLTNDLFDASTGIDEFKLHSVVALTGKRKLIRNLAYCMLALGLGLILMLASMIILSIISLKLIPLINNSRDRGEEGKKTFDRLHLISVMLNVITLIIGLIFLYLVI